LAANGHRLKPAEAAAPGALPPHRLRRALDVLYAASGALAALCLAAMCAVMLLQVAGREFRILFRGADDIVGWLCAASVFFALGHTFRKGELVRVGLFVERMRPAARRGAEIFSLGVATVFAGYMVWSVTRFVYESWKFNEVAQGLIIIPIWPVQTSLVIGLIIFFIAVLDELVTVLRGGKPAYVIAEEERRARGEFSESV
jgi:TRAP-type C4-dicarboxylate transport system permease small subunit